MAIRPFDDKAVLRTDGSDASINSAYTRAERIFDPADQPTQVPAGQKDMFGQRVGIKATMHQKAQMETAFRDRDDPTKMVQQGYTDTDLLT